MKIRTVMIVGGGRIGFYLGKMLLDMNIHVKIIENDKARCLELIELLPDAIVIHGDGTSTELLEAENIGSTDAFVALTDHDEDNLVVSLLAKQAGVHKVITKITRFSSENLIQVMGLDSIVNPRLITANYILQYVRGLKNAETTSIEALHKAVHGQVEILEFLVRQDRWYLNQPLRKLRRIGDVLIAAIVRKNDIIIPHGNDVIRQDDRVILFSRAKALDKLDDIFIVSGIT